jgi:hypothetical protein
MIWALFAYICFWVAFFCLFLIILLYLPDRVQSAGIKRFLRRFGEDPAEAAQVRGIIRRFGILFLAVGVFFWLLTAPTSQMSPEEQGMLTLAQVACALIVFWQIKGIRDFSKSQPKSGA